MRRVCKLDGCNKGIVALDMCNPHYRKFKLYGDPLVDKTRKAKTGICKIENCESPIKTKDMCIKHYKRTLKHGSPFIVKNEHKKKIDFYEDENGCFICTSHKFTKGGYPEFQRNNYKSAMHRFIYTECFGEIHPTMVVRHKCDNRKCINPEHLELGTQAQNVQDSVKRNRNAKGDMLPQTKLTVEQVIDIKNGLKKGFRACDLADKHDISRKVIHDIKYNKTWKHVVI